MENDIEHLAKHGIMDYSLYLVVVIKPYKQVDFRFEDYNPPIPNDE